MYNYNMQLIKQKKINKTIKESFDYAFAVNEDGLYIIETVASAKSWWQNFKNLASFFKDDNLAVIIDETDFPKISGQRGLFDAEAAWNGNNLNGLEKTNLFLLPLSAGNHAIKFLSKQKPTLASIVISKIDEREERKQIVYIPTINNPAQDGNRRQWLTISILDTSIKQITIKARAEKIKRDDEDIKLIIDGAIQNNEEPKAHKQWFWCGRTLDNKGKIFAKNLNLPKGLHYFEFWADGTPYLNRIEIAINDKSEEDMPAQRVPTADDPKWTGDFADDPEEILMARLIFGEARSEPDEAKEWIAWSIINRIEAHSWWGDSIREVILYDGQYDPFKPSDKNFKKIINPLADASRLAKKSWVTCYSIANDVISKKIKKPTTATHFHGIGVTQNWFEAHVVPDGKFLKKIGNTYFYWSPH